MKKLLIIGSLNLDMAVNVDHMPAVGETIISDKMDLIPGGKERIRRVRPGVCMRM